MAENIEMFLQQGFAAKDAGDYAKAAEWLRQAAEQGDAAAQYELGILYNTGQGVPQDYVKAVEWIRKAAEQGYGEAKEAIERATGVRDKMKYRNRIMDLPDGRQFTTLSRKPTADPTIFIYLLRSRDKKQDSLWNFKFLLDEECNVVICPYEGEDSDYVLLELWNDHVEHGFEHD